MTACRRNEPAGGFLTDGEILFVYFYYIYTNIHSLVSPLCSCSALHIGLFPPYEMLLQDDTNKPRNASRTAEDPAVTGRWRCTRGDRGDYWGIVKGVIQPPLPAEWDS